MGELTGKGFSLVAITNGMDALRKLDEQIKSKIVPVRIGFESYSGDEIHDILLNRAEMSPKDIFENRLMERISEVRSSLIFWKKSKCKAGGT